MGPMRGEFNQNPCSSQAGADRDRQPGNRRRGRQAGASMLRSSVPIPPGSGALQTPARLTELEARRRGMPSPSKDRESSRWWPWKLP